MQLNTERLHSQLILEEGLRLVAYDDATGKPVPPGASPRGNLTIGVGRNLDSNPFSPQEMAIIGHDGRSQPITYLQAIMLLDDDINTVCDTLDDHLPWWSTLDEIRARVMVDLTFNMGVKLLGFHDMLSAMRVADYVAAGAALKDSLWYLRAGTRGPRLVAMMTTGEDYTA